MYTIPATTLNNVPKMILVATGAFCINFILSVLEKTFTMRNCMNLMEVTGNHFPGVLNSAYP